MNGRTVHLKPDLQLVACNANSIASRYAELVDFAVRHIPVVILVGEIHLNPVNDFGCPTMCLPKRQARASRGGTAIAMRANIRHHSVDFPLRQNLEGTTLELHGALGGVLVVSAYQPPQRLLQADIDAVFTQAGNLGWRSELQAFQLGKPKVQQVR